MAIIDFNFSSQNEYLACQRTKNIVFGHKKLLPPWKMFGKENLWYIDAKKDELKLFTTYVGLTVELTSCF